MLLYKYIQSVIQNQIHQKLRNYSHNQIGRHHYSRFRNAIYRQLAGASGSQRTLLVLYTSMNQQQFLGHNLSQSGSVALSHIELTYIVKMAQK